jgi:cyclic pyranopterin monophosphate synthase
MSSDEGSLSHVDPDGRAKMVDVGEKQVTERVAVAEAIVRVSAELGAKIRENAIAKGDVLGLARLAGIQAAKRTDELIPLCHSLPLDVVDVQAKLEGEGDQVRVRIVSMAKTHARTGVEMEALTAAAVAALTVIDMGKAVDKGMVVERLRILEKRGGRSGTYIAGDA